MDSLITAYLTIAMFTYCMAAREGALAAVLAGVFWPVFWALK